VGTISRPGWCTYDPEQQTYTVEGSGANIWDNHDDFHFVWKRMTGNFIVNAQAEFVGSGVEPHRKLGWMIRPSLDGDAANINTGIHGDGLTTLQFRRTAGGPTEEVRFSITDVDVIQLERTGTTYRMSVARFGDPFVTEQIVDIELGDEVYVGLYVCSHNDAVSEQATFQNVRIVIPAKDDVVPYQDYLGSHLEILDVDTGHRRSIYSAAEPFEAPNWTPDGTALIYNSGGRLYRFDLVQQTPAVIDTGFATKNNNDHVLSFDGSMIGISHHSADDHGHSIVYTLPTGGGTPTRVTSQGPSYLRVVS
jgi:hypothetical protein